MRSPSSGRTARRCTTPPSERTTSASQRSESEAMGRTVEAACDHGGMSETDEATRVAYRTCPLCEATCGLEITLEGDRGKRIRGDRADVFSHGFICPKGSTLKQLHEDPDWLQAPRIKDGDGWREATWDEAFAAIEDGLGPIWEEHGRNAVALYLGNPSVHHMAGALYLRPLIMALNTK